MRCTGRAHAKNWWARHERRKFNLNWLEWANVLQDGLVSLPSPPPPKHSGFEQEIWKLNGLAAYQIHKHIGGHGGDSTERKTERRYF